MRWCSYHKALHPASAFSTSMQWWCREAKRENRRKNPDKVREYNERRKLRYHNGRAEADSLRHATRRKSKRIYQSRYNPLALPPEQRTA